VTRLAAVMMSGLLVAAGCSAPPVPDDVPAVVVDPDAASRKELHAVVATALGLRDITLAPDALTEDGTLLVEQKMPTGIDAPPAGGRRLDRPERFHLVLDGPQCVLVQDSTGLRWLLMDTTCAPR